jgi:hypothetical protein
VADRRLRGLSARQLPNLPSFGNYPEHGSTALCPLFPIYNQLLLMARTVRISRPVLWTLAAMLSLATATYSVLWTVSIGRLPIRLGVGEEMPPGCCLVIHNVKPRKRSRTSRTRSLRKPGHVPTKQIAVQRGNETFQRVLRLVKCSRYQALPERVWLCAGVHREMWTGITPDWPLNWCLIGPNNICCRSDAATVFIIISTRCGRSDR